MRNMENNMANGGQVIRLYRSLLRESKKFNSYNYRLYAMRKVKDCFRQHQNESDSERIRQFIKKAEKDLESLKRQTLINNIYGTSQLIIEK